MTTFRELGVHAQICDALDRAGITTPFAIQEMTLSVALLGTDLIGTTTWKWARCSRKRTSS